MTGARRSGRRRATAWALAAVAAWGVPAAAVACRCAPLSAARAFRAADSVVLARVEGSVAGGHRVAVRERWKGRRAARLLVAAPPTNCAMPLETGRDYLLYLRDGAGGAMGTDLCSGNLPAERAGDRLRALRRRPAARA